MTARTFTFDKIDFNGTGRRINLPAVELELKYDSQDRPCVAVCGEVWNSKHTDVIICGQCLDEMAEFESLANNSLFCKLHRIWKAHHLNELHAGSEKQERALDDARKAGNRLCCYEDSCKYLESIGLLVDDGYKYGSSWLYREIPEDDLKEIKSLLEN